MKKRLNKFFVVTLYWGFIIRYILWPWRWFIEHAWAPMMYATFNTWYNTFIYRKYCKRSWKLSQRLNGQRVYIFPALNNKPGMRLVTSSMIAQENRMRSKRKKLNILMLLEHSYGWSDKNTNAHEVFCKFGRHDKRRSPQKSRKD